MLQAIDGGRRGLRDVPVPWPTADRELFQKLMPRALVDSVEPTKTIITNKPRILCTVAPVEHVQRVRAASKKYRVLYTKRVPKRTFTRTYRAVAPRTTQKAIKRSS